VWGESSDARGWRVGIADPNFPFENAPLADVVTLNNAAIATSGRGPRDCTRTGYRSTTISPFTGYPVDNVISATVIASHVADADAIATACMVLDPNESIALVDKLDGFAARITDAHGRVHLSTRWTSMQFAAIKAQSAPVSTSAKSKTNSTQNSSTQNTSVQPSANKKQIASLGAVWPADWELGLTYVEPERKEDQGAEFRIPYIVLWITDEQNNPVSTVFMLGSQLKWQRDNFIWWGSHRERAPNLVHLRSQSTTLSGRYQVYWNGLDEALKPLPLGKYIVHLETSQEHGKHQYRNITIEIGHDRFKKALANEPGSGALEISYGHYNDRFKAAD
jgi:FAD:protein FMN transferase